MIDSCERPRGARVQSRRIGSGPRHVVYLHGWAASGDYWIPSVRRMDGTRWSHWLLDLPGFGHSRPAPIRHPHGRELATAVVRFLDGLGSRQIVLVGHSMGGSVAMFAAATSPRVDALVLENCTSEPPSGLDRAARIGSLRRLGLTRPMLDAGADYWYRRLSRDQRAALYAEAFRADPATLIATQQSVALGVPTDVVRLLRMPVLLIHGRGDRQRSPETAADFAARLTDGRLALVEHSAHTPHHDNPAAFARALARFLDTSRGHRADARTRAAGGAAR